MKKVYVSIPISGEDYNDQRNHAFVVATNLGVKGYDTITPFDINRNAAIPYNEALGNCVKELLECDAIYLCQGWHKSKGCRAELELAIIYGLQVLTE